MEPLEDQTEAVREQMHHHAGGHQGADKFTSRVSLSTAVLAVFAAITSLMAGHHANEAMIDQIKAANEWSYYQAKSIKSSVLGSKMDLQRSMDITVDDADEEKAKSYEEDKDKISEKAKEREEESEHHLSTHVIFARAVTMFQVAIAIGAIAALTKRRKFLTVSLVFGVAGLGFFGWGLMQ